MLTVVINHLEYVFRKFDDLRAYEHGVKGQLKVSFYVAQYPVLRTAQSVLHFTSHCL